MTLLDRYITKKFLSILVFSMMAFVIIFLVIDLIENIDKFIDRKATLNQVVLYYVYYIPYIINLTLPVAMLLSSLFTLGNMTQHNELVAQKSAGISQYRIFTPLFISAFFISILAGIFNETVVPFTNQERLDIYRHEIKKHPRTKGMNRNNIYIQDELDRKISIGFFSGVNNTARKISVLYYNGTILKRRLDAKSMKWKDDVWVMADVVERTFTDREEKVSTHTELIATELNIIPESLLELQRRPEEMSYSQLKRFVKEKLRIGAEVRKWIVEINLKISYPFANFIIVLFGAPLAARKRRSGQAVGIGISLMVCFVYFIFIRTGQVMGHQGDLQPWLAAWFGNIIFGAAGLITLFKARI